MDIAVGDTIETSGLGGIYPKGIIIGKVKEVRRKTNDLNRYAIIEPAVDFKRLEKCLCWKAKIIKIIMKSRRRQQMRAKPVRLK